MTCLTCVDIAWLIDSGERHLPSIARRTGSRAARDDDAVDVLRRHLRRHNRLDLLNRLKETA